ncbi:MAG: aldehyde dehydrogenase family protein [Deltaproteobacteria bacterium]|jgi:succinate-semialdehyde dehydrogenase|nr:aldehyde dehydrogenase family protein [Deltaproteobacteria bacterium]
MDVQAKIDDMMAKSRAALKVLYTYNQEQVDALCKAICLAFKEKAVEFSKEAIEETGMGNYDHKLIKNAGTPDGMWLSVKGQKSVGVIGEDKEHGITFIGQPKGVIATVCPTTNPNMTALANAVMCIKGRNTVIVCPHPRAAKTTTHSVEVMNEALKKLGAPDHIIQVVPEISVEVTQAVMRACDTTIATGGPGMVRSAYSSGKPAFGVGAGNVQGVIDRGYDLNDAVGQIIVGRAFDNGQVCACNQSAIYPREVHDEIVKVFKAQGAHFVSDPAEIAKYRAGIFPDGKHSPKVVGQSPARVAQECGTTIPDNTSVIVLLGDSKKYGANELLCGEKMCPVLIAIPYDDWEEAVDIAVANLLYSGAGHTCCLFSNDDDRVVKAATRLPVCRVMVNQFGPNSINVTGTNGLPPTSTLGCGSWGGSSVDENVTFRHLINISRVARNIPGAKPPAADEIYS